MEKPGQALARALCALASTQDLEGYNRDSSELLGV